MAASEVAADSLWARACTAHDLVRKASTWSLQFPTCPAPAVAVGIPTNTAVDGKGDADAGWVKDQDQSEWDVMRLKQVQSRIKESGDALGSFWVDSYQARAQRAWDEFYKSNTVNFFKDRHYLERDFPCLRAAAFRPFTLLEFGCGVGNAFIPLLPRLPKLRVVAFDLSSTAIDLIQAHPACQAPRVNAFVADPTVSAFPPPALASDPVCTGTGADAVLMLFMLSAMEPATHRRVFHWAAQLLRPGGRLLFRDYGDNDEAMLRFKKGHKVAPRLYVRGDGTMAYFFTPQELVAHAAAVGLQVQQATFLHRKYTNRAQGKSMSRIFTHAVLVKPSARAGAGDARGKH